MGFLSQQVQPRGGFLGGMADISGEDLNDHSSLVPIIWQVNITFIALVGVVVLLRIGTRAFLTKRLFLDDTFAVLAAIFTIASSSTALLATRYGLGRHVWDIPLPLDNILYTMKRCIQILFVANVFYAVATCFTKISIITSYLRIFPDARLRWLLIGTIFVVFAFGISSVFACIFQCSPVSAAWDFTIEDSKCYNFRDFLYASAAVNIATDFILCVAPLPYLWALNMPVRQKLAVCLLFCVGFAAFASSVVRITTLWHIQGVDVTRSLVLPLNWTMIECSLGIICVSIPPLRPLFSRMAPGFLSTHRSQGASDYGKHMYAKEATPRTPHETRQDIEQEMDRQLEEIEMCVHSHDKGFTSSVTELTPAKTWRQSSPV